MARRFSVKRGTTRIVFGEGSVELVERELQALGLDRVLVVGTPGRRKDADSLAARVGPRAVGVLATAREHVPVEIVTAARAEVERTKADALVAIGGGSAIGLAKALSLETPARVVAIPTTYSGSEMTPILGVTEGGQKRVGRDERARPVLVVYDPKLTRDLPRDITITSLWNAMAHAVEALWADGVDRAALLTAEEALRLLAKSLGRLAVEPGDVEARDEALEGAYLAGAVFADIGGGLHHKICHVLGGAFGLPHAATHAVVLPHVVRFKSLAAPEAMASIGRALGVLDAALALERLARDTLTTRGLAELGMPAEGIARVADAVLAAPEYQKLDRAALVAMLEAAHAAPAVPAPTRLRAPNAIATQPGFGGTHDSEAISGALPHRQNTPRPPPLGLYPELLSGTPFTVRSTQNSRIWMYRLRASFSHDAFRPLHTARFATPLEDVDPNRTRWRPMPIPPASSRVDFLDGLVTLGGAGEPTAGPGYAVHLYAANADMSDRSFSNADGDVLIVPQSGAIDCRTELGWLRAAPGTVILVPRGMKFAVGLPEGTGRGWMAEVFGPRFRLPERGPIGSNGLADARHFLAPTASFEDRLCPAGFEIVHKIGGDVYAATQEHSPFDVVAWHGTHVPFSYDLMLFNAMGSVTWDHPDPSILTVLTAPLDEHGRAVVDFVVFPPRWMVSEHSFRPPYMHRNAASEINGVIRAGTVDHGYEPGCTFVSPLLTAHGISTASYDDVLSQPDETADSPERFSDDSLWMMFESAMPFRATAWAKQTPLRDDHFLDQFKGMRTRFDPGKGR